MLAGQSCRIHTMFMKNFITWPCTYLCKLPLQRISEENTNAVRKIHPDNELKSGLPCSQTLPNCFIRNFCIYEPNETLHLPLHNFFRYKYNVQSDHTVARWLSGALVSSHLETSVKSKKKSGRGCKQQTSFFLLTASANCNSRTIVKQMSKNSKNGMHASLAKILGVTKVIKAANLRFSTQPSTESRTEKLMQRVKLKKVQHGEVFLVEECS